MKRILTYVLLLIGVAYAYAMPVYEDEWSVPQTYQSQQIMSTGVTYRGTIYEPFDNSLPSDYSEVGASYAPGKQELRRVPEGVQPRKTDSPVGEPWILLLFAAIFAGIKAIKRRRFIHN